MFDQLTEMALAALTVFLTAAVPIIVPAARRWISEAAAWRHIANDTALAQRLDEGATNILIATIKQLTSRPGGVAPTEEQVLDRATEKMERNFPQTLTQMKLNRMAVRDFLRARVHRANGVIDLHDR